MRPVFFFPHATIIDCGASRTSLAVFSGARKGRLRLEHYAAVPFAAEAGQEGSWLQHTSEALVTLRARLKPAGPVIVVLPPHLTLMKMLSTPRVEAAKRDKIINFEGQQSIPYPLTDVVWDRQITGENEHGFNVLLCAAKLEVLDPLCAALIAADLAPVVLLPSVLALTAGCREMQPEQEMPTLLINLGARSTTLVLKDKNGFQARSLSLGGGGVTQQMVEEQGGGFAQAEELKRSGSNEGAIAPSVQTLANRLAQEITRTLVYFRRPIAPESPLRLVLMGGAARLPGLAGLLAKQLNVAVAVFDAAVGGIEIGREAGDFSRPETRSALVELVGGAVGQLRAGQPAFNLLPPRLRSQAGRRRLRPRLAVAAGLAVAVLALGILHQRKALAVAHAHNMALERQLAPLRVSATRNQELRQQATEAQRQQIAWGKVDEARSGWLRFLGEIQARFIATGDVWLERMQLVTTSAAGESGRPAAGQPLRLAFSGLMRTKAESASGAGAENYQRIRSLLEGIAGVSSVAAVESERFETESSGQLRFEFVVVFKEPFAL